MSLDLQFEVDVPTTLRELPAGSHFVLSDHVEGKLIALGESSATVAIQRDGRWERTAWSLETVVRRLRV
ncbi:MAG: hypothetical protein ACE5FJ_03460 [Gemmatimonadales bacterium]